MRNKTLNQIAQEAAKYKAYETNKTAPKKLGKLWGFAGLSVTVSEMYILSFNHFLKEPSNIFKGGGECEYQKRRLY